MVGVCTAQTGRSVCGDIPSVHKCVSLIDTACGTKSYTNVHTCTELVGRLHTQTSTRVWSTGCKHLSGSGQQAANVYPGLGNWQQTTTDYKRGKRERGRGGGGGGGGRRTRALREREGVGGGIPHIQHKHRGWWREREREGENYEIVLND